MNDTLPYLFFFSYSRADWEYDAYLAKFFEDLEKKVAMARGVGTRKVGFRDEEGVKTGEDWTRKISAAVQASHVLVCIYTPNFFSVDRTHEFCAREFMAFLQRDPQHRYERVIEHGGCERYELREARNILPILWLSERELVELNKLPPHAVRTIQYSLSGVPRTLNDLYKEKGMSLITTQRRGTYREILMHLATRIVELAANPLPSLSPPPDARTLRNAFWPENVPADSAAPDLGDGDADALGEVDSPSLGPKQLVAFEVRSTSGDAPAWAPFPGEPSLRVLVEEIAQSRRRTSRYRTFDPGTDDFVTALLAALIEATEKRFLPIVFVDPKALARPEWRVAVTSLLRHHWRGGIVVPIDASDEPSALLMESMKPDFERTPNQREWVVFRVVQGGISEFRAAVMSAADDILARIVMYGSVERSTPATIGPSVRPRGKLLQAEIEALRKNYDFILIDSRTGVSDTSGICTVQLPDMLAMFFTLNRQSIKGAAAVASSVQAQRGLSFPIFPVPTRIENGEQLKSKLATAYARRAFAPFLLHVQSDHSKVMLDQQAAYWHEVETLYISFYAFEEVPAAFMEEGAA